MPLLRPDEAVIGRWQAHVVGPSRDANVLRRLPTAAAGSLYVTSERLIHLGCHVTDVPLAALLDLAVARRRLMASLAGALGLIVHVDEPRELRVQLAAARSALRSRQLPERRSATTSRDAYVPALRQRPSR